MRAINWLTLVIAIIAVVFGVVAFIQTNALKGNYESLIEDVTELTAYVDESLTHLTEAVNANSQSLTELNTAVNQEMAKLATKEYVDQNVAHLTTHVQAGFDAIQDWIERRLG